MGDDTELDVPHTGNMSEARHFYLREWRKFRGLTLEELGHRIGTSKGRVSDIERGARRYNEDLIEQFAKALDCEPWELIGRDPTNEKSQPWAAIFADIPEDKQEHAREILESFTKKRA
jgi:transcriptional regulator with XRE-family HTH domain